MNNVSLPVIFYIPFNCRKKAAITTTFFDLFKELEKIDFEIEDDKHTFSHRKRVLKRAISFSRIELITTY
jgi:hypothetical protein